MQGVLLVVLGIGLMYLAISGKLDCIIAAFRACAGYEKDSSGSSTTTPTTYPLITPTDSPTENVQAKAIIDAVLSPRTDI